MSDAIDLELLDQSFAELLGSEWPRERSVAHARSGHAYAVELWDQMASLGWTALAVPEAHGGLGLGIAGAARLHTALGAAAAPAPMLGTTIAAALVACAGTEAQRASLLPALADGSMRIGMAQPDAPPLDFAPDSVTGSAPDILDAPAATHLLLAGLRGGTACWLIVPANATGLSIVPHPLVDTSRSLGTVRLEGVRLADGALIEAPPAIPLADLLLHWGCVALAADSLGIGEAVLDATIGYLKVREQFGKVIGSFQALKHRVADHKTALVGARELLAHAASLDPLDPANLVDALSAKAHITRTASEVARDCIQLHGGVGFTAEFQPHIYLKRAKLNEALGLPRNQLLDRVADLLEAA